MVSTTPYKIASKANICTPDPLQREANVSLTVVIICSTLYVTCIKILCTAIFCSFTPFRLKIITIPCHYLNHYSFQSEKAHFSQKII